MKYRVKLETVLLVIEYATMPIASWPLPRGTSTFLVRRQIFFWWFAFIHMLVSSLTWFYNIYLNAHDIDVVVPIVSELGPLYSAVFKMLICKIYARHLQNLIAELHLFLKEASALEREVIQSYVDKCFNPHAIVFGSVIVGPIVFMILPAVTPKVLPATTAYPFSLDTTWVYVSLYCSHILLGCQAGCIHVLDFLFSIFIWVAGARFEMLSDEFEQAANADDVKRCIKKHQELIAYVERMNVPIRVMSLEVTVICVFTVTTGGFVLVRRDILILHRCIRAKRPNEFVRMMCNPCVQLFFGEKHPPWIVIIQYLFFEFLSGLELYLLAWPADNLMKMSRRIGNAAFGSAWIGKSREMTQDLLITMQRSRVPETISIGGVIPAVTLEFFGSCLSMSFSYLTTLRAMAID